MAFTNKASMKISYDAENLINELEQDIKEFGSDYMVECVVEKMEGVLIYKDYWDVTPASDIDKPTLKETEKIITIKATDLLELYKKENKIL